MIIVIEWPPLTKLIIMIVMGGWWSDHVFISHHIVVSQGASAQQPQQISMIRCVFWHLILLLLLPLFSTFIITITLSNFSVWAQRPPLLDKRSLHTNHQNIARCCVHLLWPHDHHHHIRKIIAPVAIEFIKMKNKKKLLPHVWTHPPLSRVSRLVSVHGQKGNRLV